MKKNKNIVNKKTLTKNKKKLNLNNKILFKFIIMSELKPQAVKLKWETAEKLKKLDINIAWVDLLTYDDKINHLVWFFENYKKKHKEEIENKLL